jgi:hypothetical protein
MKTFTDKRKTIKQLYEELEQTENPVTMSILKDIICSRALEMEGEYLKLLHPSVVDLKEQALLDNAEEAKMYLYFKEQERENRRLVKT